MKVTLIQPKNEHWINNFEITTERIKPVRYDLLSLLAISAVIESDCEVQILDEKVDGIDFNESRDIVGITVMTCDAPRAYKIAEEFRARNVKVVLGGIHPTACMNEALEHCDTIVIGEAEYTWPQLIHDYKEGQLKRVYKADRLCDLAKLERVSRDNLSKNDNFNIVSCVQTTRGCPNRCNYCTITAFNKNTYRKRPIEDVIEDIKSINSREFLFIDDNLVGDYTRAKELFRNMIGLNKRWTSQMTLSFADDKELLDLAQKSGCRSAFVGIESLSKENLIKLNKSVNKVERLEEQIKKVQDKGINLEAAFITGLDCDDEGVFEQIYKFCEKNKISTVNVWVYTPFPGTPLFDEMKRQDRIINYNWEYYDFCHVVIKPKGMKGDRLQEEADQLRKYFASKEYRSKRISSSMDHIRKIVQENRNNL